MRGLASRAMLAFARFVFNAQIFLTVVWCRVRHPFDARKQRRLYGELRLAKLAKRKKRGGLMPSLVAGEERALQSDAAFTTRFSGVSDSVQAKRLDRAEAKRKRRAARASS